MPYVPKADRFRFSAVVNALNEEMAKGITPGELNYLLTGIADNYVAVKGKSYTHMNDVLGAFSGASKEFYRRVVAPYEEEKINENGDVYTVGDDRVYH